MNYEATYLVVLSEKDMARKYMAQFVIFFFGQDNFPNLSSRPYRTAYYMKRFSVSQRSSPT